MSTIKTVAIAGASGDLGSHVFKKFAASKFTIKVLKRAGSESTFPEGTEVVEVDYSSVDSLTAALKGQDAVVSTLTTLAAGAQETLIDAAVAAGVKRFIPSEFGSNLDIPSVRALPLFGAKVAVQEKLKALAAEGKISYTFVYNSVFLDWATLIDGGNSEFSTTSLDSVADAVVGVVSHPEETKNRVVYIQDAVLTQKKVLELAQKANPDKTWTVKEAVLDDLINIANERLAKGLLDWETFGAYLYRAIYDPASVAKFPKLDNELLGLKGKSDEEVYEIIKAAAQ
ncbi:hypothetical protein CEP52_007707 [Fusarium oligoseptatum]|uniref:NmrA-like domain-containing protein n=1 Tax=Fusarium oligoseptatum TaxID=2604345 RepID=A0A428TLK3_9HYPO|nr:hypothetical protein CEP52_007707 [Fusarium oligoseptatum]